MTPHYARTAGREIVPFWNRIPRFFLYPLHPTTLVLMLVVAALMSAVQPSLPGFVGLVILLAVSLKYAYYLLDHTAHGNLKPPALTRDFFLGDYSVLFKQIVILVVAGIAAAIVGKAFGMIALILFLIAAALAYPASIMVLATTNSFFRAINPAVLFDMMRSIGWAYLILSVFLIALNAGSERAMYLIGEDISPQAQVALATFFGLYFTYIMYNMMGYVIYQYHDRLGLTPMAVDESPATAIEYPGMEEVEQFIQADNFPAAVEAMKAVIRANPDDLELRIRFHRLVRLTPDTRQLTYHGQVLITRLLDARRSKDAMDVYLDCLNAEPDFRPEQKETYLPLARALRAYGKTREALALVNGLHKRFPGEDLVADNYLLAVEILVDDLHQEEKAKPILLFLGKNFQNHPLQPQILGYQMALGLAPFSA